MKTLLLFLFGSSLVLQSPLIGQELVVHSFNIRYDNPRDGDDRWEVRREEVKDFILYKQPDIIGFQEVVGGQLEFLSKGLPSYAFVGVGREDGSTKGEYAPVFYSTERYTQLEQGTFWLSETPNEVSTGWDAALPRICTYVKLRDKNNEETLWIFNTHFDHRGKEARKQSARLILRRIDSLAAPEDTVILMGDLNAEESAPPIKLILNEFKEPWEASPLRRGPKGTFNGFQLLPVDTPRLDYIFSRGLRLLKYRHVDSRRSNGRQLSDHLAVEAVYSPE